MLARWMSHFMRYTLYLVLTFFRSIDEVFQQFHGCFLFPRGICRCMNCFANQNQFFGDSFNPNAIIIWCYFIP